MIGNERNGDAAEVDRLVNFITTKVRTDRHAAFSDMSSTQRHVAEIQTSVDKMVCETISTQEVHPSDLREMEGDLTILERRCENLDSSLKDQEIQHAMDVRALERQIGQERAERARGEENLLDIIMTVAIRREKMLSELRKRQGTGGAERNPPTLSLHERFRRWLSPILSRMLVSQGSPLVNPSFGRIRLPINNLQNIYERSRRGIQGALRARTLERITKLEERVRQAEREQLRCTDRAKEKAKKTGNQINFSGTMRQNETVGSDRTDQPGSSQSQTSFFRCRREAKAKKPLAKE